MVTWEVWNCFARSTTKTRPSRFRISRMCRRRSSFSTALFGPLARKPHFTLDSLAYAKVKVIKRNDTKHKITRPYHGSDRTVPPVAGGSGFVGTATGLGTLCAHRGLWAANGQCP